MGTSSVQQWMTNEIERLSSKWQRYKPTGSGYNRIQSVRLSKSVTHMLNNPLPPEDRLGKPPTRRLSQGSKGVLSCSPSEWEEVYPNVNVNRPGLTQDVEMSQPQTFTYYRNCATRVT
ncbi:hypothetical protein FF38_09434 [Lucilia cuprina]|uniref:Uncharacterized protein n=1 Tax=Lucilia cuprina TaxID=7375 RepID=A0A0L0C8Z2_LUCCU|nr:uncharacterized protein LOC111681081 [Lucilia cuprina]KAI8125810.1 hypothetical protein CVS40_4041 [Lucilia cuprina]KNC28712.1 hypothetical protein FF38_09434 [Lucilia cuprina]